MCSRFKLSKNKSALPDGFWNCHRYAENPKVGSSFELHMSLLQVALFFPFIISSVEKTGKQS